MLEPPTADPLVRQELTETLYHVLWELVHVFFEHRGLLEGRTERRARDVGASSFLYPFLAEQEDDLTAVLADVAASVVMKAEEASALREATVTGSAGRWRPPPPGCATRSPPAGRCSRSATAARRPTPPTSSPTSRRRPRARGGARAGRST